MRVLVAEMSAETVADLDSDDVDERCAVPVAEAERWPVNERVPESDDEKVAERCAVSVFDCERSWV